MVEDGRVSTLGDKLLSGQMFMFFLKCICTICFSVLIGSHSVVSLGVEMPVDIRLHKALLSSWKSEFLMEQQGDQVHLIDNQAYELSSEESAVSYSKYDVIVDSEREVDQAPSFIDEENSRLVGHQEGLVNDSWRAPVVEDDFKKADFYQDHLPYTEPQYNRNKDQTGVIIDLSNWRDTIKNIDMDHVVVLPEGRSISEEGGVLLSGYTIDTQVGKDRTRWLLTSPQRAREEFVGQEPLTIWAIGYRQNGPYQDIYLNPEDAILLENKGLIERMNNGHFVFLVRGDSSD